MAFDWKNIARIGAAIVAGETGHAEIMGTEQAAEVAIDASISRKPVTDQVDAYAALAVQAVETAEGFKGAELVDDANVQLLVKGVHDALTALVNGLAAKKLIASVPAGVTVPSSSATS